MFINICLTKAMKKGILILFIPLYATRQANDIQAIISEHESLPPAACLNIHYGVLVSLR